MPVERPTFSESWYRVADLRPRLRATVQITRQHFRGRMWHVVQDPGSNQFFRLSDPAYRFVALLDGHRTVGEVWDICNEQLGDDAPTQGESIQLMGQLYTSNLLQAEVTPDTQGLFNRYQKRVRREVKGYLTNLLFARIPLFDPDHFLDKWVKVFGAVFSWWGMILWAILVMTGLYFILGRADELAAQSQTMLEPDKLPLLYLSFILVKVIHEFGHAFSCKRFGLRYGGGEVHTLGIMLLIFVPMPYVDASSAWAFRSKWQRMVVGAGGMLVELAVASVAAIVWAVVGEEWIRVLAYNAMFIASVSTLLFNANPLLRYDGYYILSDLLEIPNLAQRSKTYLQYLVRKYAWGVRNPQNPAHTRGEKVWFFFYGIASTIYRVFILVAILLFLSDRLPEQFKMIAIGFAIVSGVAWLCVPVFKFIRYLATNNELARVRMRAVGSTLVLLALVLGVVGAIPMPDRFRAEGVVEPVGLAFVHAGSDGYIQTFLPSGTHVTPEGEAVVNDVSQVKDVPKLWHELNPALAAQWEQLKAEQRQLQARYRLAMNEGRVALAQAYEEQIQAKKLQIQRAENDLSRLSVRSSIAGTWVSPDIEKLKGQYVRRGQQIGMVATLDDLIIRVTAKQEVGEFFVKLHKDGWDVPVEVRVRGRPGVKFEGVIRKIFPAGRTRLPAASLGYPAGGAMAVEMEDKEGTTATKEFFEFHIAPKGKVALQPGQRVVVRFEAPAKPKLLQWYRGLLQLLQKKR